MTRIPIGKAVLLALMLLATVWSPVPSIAGIFSGPDPTPFRTEASAIDEFVSGGSTSGTIGDLGWHLNGTGCTYGHTTPIANDFGIGALGTPVTINTLCTLFLPSAPYRLLQIDAAPNAFFKFYGRGLVGGWGADEIVRSGLSDSYSAAPFSGFYIERLNTDTNLFCVSRNLGSQTRNNSGINPLDGFVTFQLIQLSLTQYQCSIQQLDTGKTFSAIHTTHVPQSGDSFFYIWQIQNTTANVEVLETEYWVGKLGRISR